MDDISRCLGSGESACNVDLPTCEAAVELLASSTIRGPVCRPRVASAVASNGR